MAFLIIYFHKCTIRSFQMNHTDTEVISYIISYGSVLYDWKEDCLDIVTQSLVCIVPSHPILQKRTPKLFSFPREIIVVCKRVSAFVEL